MRYLPSSRRTLVLLITGVTLGVTAGAVFGYQHWDRSRIQGEWASDELAWFRMTLRSESGGRRLLGSGGYLNRDSTSTTFTVAGSRIGQAISLQLSVGSSFEGALQDGMITGMFYQPGSAPQYIRMRRPESPEEEFARIWAEVSEPDPRLARLRARVDSIRADSVVNAYLQQHGIDPTDPANEPVRLYLRTYGNGGDLNLDSIEDPLAGYRPDWREGRDRVVVPDTAVR